MHKKQRNQCFLFKLCHRTLVITSLISLTSPTSEPNSRLSKFILLQLVFFVVYVFLKLFVGIEKSILHTLGLMMPLHVLYARIDLILCMLVLYKTYCELTKFTFWSIVFKWPSVTINIIRILAYPSFTLCFYNLLNVYETKVFVFTFGFNSCTKDIGRCVCVCMRILFNSFHIHNVSTMSYECVDNRLRWYIMCFLCNLFAFMKQDETCKIFYTNICARWWPIFCAVFNINNINMCYLLAFVDWNSYIQKGKILLLGLRLLDIFCFVFDEVIFWIVDTIDEATSKSKNHFFQIYFEHWKINLIAYESCSTAHVKNMNSWVLLVRIKTDVSALFQLWSESRLTYSTDQKQQIRTPLALIQTEKYTL